MPKANRLALLIPFLWGLTALAQPGPPNNLLFVTSNPSGGCSVGPTQLNISVNPPTWWGCNTVNNQWVQLNSGSSGSGTPGGSQYGTQYNAGSGNFGGTGPGTSGQLYIAQGGSGPALWETASGACTVSNTGVFTCNSGTITASPQYEMPYFSAAGTSSTLTGTSLLNTNGTLFSIGQAIGSVDYQVKVMNLVDSNPMSPPGCYPSCTPSDNTATSFLITDGVTPDSTYENLFPQRIVVGVLATTTGSTGVVKGFASNMLAGTADAAAAQFNCAMKSTATGLDCIGLDIATIDNNQIGAGGIGNPGVPVQAGNLIELETNMTATCCISSGSPTPNGFGTYILVQSPIYQPAAFYGIFGQLSNKTGASGRYVPNPVPLNGVIVADNGLSSGLGILLRSTAPGSSGTLTTSGASNETITSVSGSDYSLLWGPNNSAGSTLSPGNAGNVDQIYIAGATGCPLQVCTLSAVSTTSTVATITSNPGATLTNVAWSMVAPSQAFEQQAQVSPLVTCANGCYYQQLLDINGNEDYNPPNGYIFYLGGAGAGVPNGSFTNLSGTVASFVIGNTTGSPFQGIYYTASSTGVLGGWSTVATSANNILGPAAALTNNSIPRFVVSSINQVITQGDCFDNLTTFSCTETMLVTSVAGGSGNNSSVIQTFAGNPAFTGEGAQGTAGSPTVATTANGLVEMLGLGYNGSAYVAGGYVSVVPTQTWTGTANGAEINLVTTANNTTIQTVAVTLGQDQSATFFGGMTAASLATTGTIGGSVCATAAGIFVYKAGVNCEAGGGSSFSALTSGTNTAMAGVVGSGASLAVSGSGTIAATSAINLASGAAGSLSYQTGAGATGFLASTGYSVLISGATNPQYSTPTANGQCFMSAASSYATTVPSFQSCPGGGGSPTWETNGTSLGAQGTGNFINAQGILITGSATGGVASITVAPDPAFLEYRVAFAQGGDISAISASGSGTAYTATIGVSSGVVLTQNMVINWVPDVTCGANPTLNINSLGAIALEYDVAGTLTPLSTGQCTANVPYTLKAFGSPVTAFIVTPQLFYASTGANAALSNLAAVSINTSLLAQTTVDLGSTSAPFRNLYLYGGGTFGTDSFELTGTSTANRTVTLPDNSGTVAELNFAETFSAVQTFGTNISIGGVTATGATGTGNVVFSASPTMTGTLTVPAITASGQISAGSLAGSAFGTNVATFLATPSGANFNAMIAAGGVPIAQNSQSAAYVTVLSDGGGEILHPTADNNARTFTIAANSSVAYPVGTVLTFVNQINTLTIAINTDTLQLAGTATTGSRTLAAGGIATATKVTSTIWYISGPGLT